MSLTKSIGTLIATVLVGSVTVLFSAPKKATRGKQKPAKTSTQNGIAEREDLFI